MSDRLHNEGKAEAATTHLQVMVHECWPGGPVVSNPEDCRNWDRSAGQVQPPLPPLTINNG